MSALQIRKSNRVRKGADLFDPSNVQQTKRVKCEIRDVSDNIASSNKPSKQSKNRRYLKKPKANEYIPLQEKEYEMILPLNPTKVGFYPGHDNDHIYFVEDIIARRINENGEWEFKLHYLGWDNQLGCDWKQFHELDYFSKRRVYEKYTLKKLDPIYISSKEEELVEQEMAITKKITDKRNEELRKRDLPFHYWYSRKNKCDNNDVTCDDNNSMSNNDDTASE